jgi:hypothetical protein
LEVLAISNVRIKNAKIERNLGRIKQEDDFERNPDKVNYLIIPTLRNSERKLSF